MLLILIREQLTELEKGIQGLIVMSTDLEAVFESIFIARVPPSWERAYPSMKPLAAWTRDLVARVDQFEKWATTAHPPMVFWLSGFTFPTGNVNDTKVHNLFPQRFQGTEFPCLEPWPHLEPCPV